MDNITKKKGLLVSDIDGTLIGSSDDKLSKRVCDAFERLSQAGWDIMLATGRLFQTSVTYAKQAHSTLPIITCGGARIQDIDTGKNIISFPMDKNFTLKLIDMALDYEVEVQVSVGDKICCRPQDKSTINFYSMYDVELETVVTEDWRPTEDIYRIMFIGENHVLRSLRKRLEPDFEDQLEACFSGEYYLDILANEVSKGHALKAWMATVDVQYGQVVVIGDEENDLSMLKEADFPVTLENGVHLLQQVARMVVPHQSEDGIVHLIEHILKEDIVK